MGRWKSALRIYDQMLQVDPDWYILHLGKGRVFWQLRRYRQAEAAFEKACTLNPGSTSACDGWGRCLFRRGDTEKARAIWAKAAEQDPQEPRNWYGLAQWAARERDAVAAQAYAERCLRLRMDNARLHWILAQAALSQGKRRLFRKELKAWGRRCLVAAWIWVATRVWSFWKWRSRRDELPGICTETDSSMV